MIQYEAEHGLLHGIYRDTLAQLFTIGYLMVYPEIVWNQKSPSETGREPRIKTINYETI